MATITNSNLYPPVVDTYMPAFLIDGDNELKKICKVYFSISSFNSRSEIKNAQVTLTNQNTNVSALSTLKYPCGIKLSPIYEDVTKTTEDRYYIEIEPSDLEPEYDYDEEKGRYTTSKFNINQYYKVQIRFTSAEAPDISVGMPPSDYDSEHNKYNDAQSIDSWLTANLNKFSEWSTVCLIRGISAPILTVKGLDANADSSTWAAPNVDLIGTLTFINTLETETLKSYRVKLFDNNKELLTDSGDLYSNSYTDVNEIKYTFKYNFQDGENYSIQLSYITKNLYEETVTYNFTIIEGTIGALEATIAALPDVENGRIGINIKGLTTEEFVGNITIRRTSNESNFKLWEDVFTASIVGEPLDYTWYDYTIESGVWYKYCAQRRDTSGKRGIVLTLNEPQMIVFDDMFLNAEGTQLCLRFDPQITSFKRTISEAKIDTIGSKYPFINRNGYMDYKEFPIGGLITCFMNHDNIFTSKEDMYGEDVLELYKDYNDKKRITDFNDYTYERDFREKVLDFLNKNTVKLFRSATEGNILVKLMNISLTPNATLGRRIYSFTCTAYEIDDFTLENCNKYGIINLGNYQTVLEYKNEYLGQLNQTFKVNEEIFNILADKYKGYAKDGYEIQIEEINYLKLEMTSDPYLIAEGENGPVVTTDPAAADYTGYIVYINNKPIIIEADKGKIYELKGQGISVTSITFAADTTAIIDYNVVISQKQKEGTSVLSSNYYKEVGQISGVFQNKESVYQQIWNKHYEETETTIQKMVTLNAVKIEAEVGTVVYIKENGENNFDKHIIGDTCILEVNNDNSFITGLYFAGMHFLPASEIDLERRELSGNIYKEINDKIYNSLSDISPITNGVYSLSDGKKYIYYNQTWWLFENEEISCATVAIIDYYYEIMKGMRANGI